MFIANEHTLATFSLGVLPGPQGCACSAVEEETPKKSQPAFNPQLI